MSYTVESVNNCTKKILFNFESVDLSDQIQRALSEKQKTTNLKGFRKGKAPLEMIQKVYGPQIESDALNRFIQDEFFKAVDTEKIRVIGYPSFENMKYEKGEKISFDALVETFPEFELKDMSKLKFTQDKVDVTDEEVEDIKKNYLNSKAEMKEIEDEAKELANGDFAVMNFQGVMKDGSEPENMKGEEFLLEIGSNQFIPGFEEGMIGMKKGDHRDVQVTFPEDYHAADLQKAEVTFKVDVLEIKQKIMPELNDELAKEFGFDSAEDFMTKNRDNLEQQKKRQADEKLHQEILEKLIEENSFEVPKALVAEQEKYVQEDLKRSLQQQGFTDQMMTEYFEKWKDDVESKALFQVRSGLILDKLANQFSIETSDADFDEKIEQTAKTSGMSIDEIKKFYAGNDKMKNNMMYAIREEKTFIKIKEQVKIA